MTTGFDYATDSIELRQQKAILYVTFLLILGLTLRWLDSKPKPDVATTTATAHHRETLLPPNENDGANDVHIIPDDISEISTDNMVERFVLCYTENEVTVFIYCAPNAGTQELELVCQGMRNATSKFRELHFRYAVSLNNPDHAVHTMTGLIVFMVDFYVEQNTHEIMYTMTFTPSEWSRMNIHGLIHNANMNNEIAGRRVTACNQNNIKGAIELLVAQQA